MAATYDLGVARGVVDVEYKDSGLKKADEDIRRVGKSGVSSDVALRRLSNTLAIAGGAIVAGLGLAVRAAANFEERMSAVKAVSGASAAEMEKVRSKALQIGKDTSFSASEAGTAIEELVKAGISVPDVLNGAADAVVALAAAGQVELPEAATIAANAMNVFKLSAKEMPQIADLIAGAANASAIDVHEFGFSLSQAGAVAALAGVPFKDLAVAIAEMGNAGIKGSDAGTSLKTFLSNLIPTTKKQTTLFKELGLMTANGANQFFDATGKIKSLAQVSEVLQKATKGMTKEQKLANLEILFGSDSIRAAAILADNGAKGFNTLATSMGKVTAADVAKTRLDNLKGSLEQMKGSLETAAIQIGAVLIPQIRSVVDRITGWINAFSELDPSTQRLILTIAKIVASALLFSAVLIRVARFVKSFKVALETLKLLGPITKLFGLFGKGISIVITAFRALSVALLTNPFFLVVAGIVALVVAIVIAYKRSQTFRNIVQTVFKWLKDNVPPILTAIKNIAIAVFNAIVSGAKSFASAMISTWNAVWGFLAPIVRVAFTIISTIIKVQLAVITTIIKVWIAVIKIAFNVFQTILPIITAVFGFIVAYFKLVFAVIRLIVTVQIAIIVNVIRAALFAIRAVWNAVWAVVAATIRTVWGVIRAVVNAGMAAVRAVVNAGMSAIRAVVSGVVGAISATWRAFWGSALGGAVRSGVSAVLGAVRAIAQIVTIVAGVMVRFVTAVGNGIKNAVTAVARGVVGILKPVTDLASKFFNAGVEIIASLIRGITSMIGKITDTIGKVTSAVGRFIPGSPVRQGALRVLNRGGAGRRIGEMLADGIRAGGRDAINEADSLAASVAARLARSVAFNAAVGGVGTGGGVIRPGTTENAAAGLSGVSGGRVFAPVVTVNNPKPVSGPAQVVDALRQMDIIYQPLGVI